MYITQAFYIFMLYDCFFVIGGLLMLVSLIFSEIQAHNERITGCNHRWLTLPNYIGIQWAHGISLKVLCNYID